MKKELLSARQNQTENFSIQFERAVTVHEILKQYAASVLDKYFLRARHRQLNQFIFYFSMCYQNEKWILRKTLPDLVLFYQSLRKRFHKEIPAFPIQKQHDLSPNNIQQFGDFLTLFMKRVVNVAFYEEEVQNFFNILPEKVGHGIIYGQNQLKKLSGGRYTEGSCLRSIRQTICPCFRNWRNRFFTVTDHGIFYTDKRKSFEIKEMITFSHKFKVQFGQQQTDEELGILINSSSRQLTLKATNLSDFALFLSSVLQSFKKCPHSSTLRFESFAPVHQNCSTKFYIDGEQYFSDLCAQLKKAKKYVYITGWMITPYFQLKRPCELDDRRSRYDYVLEEIANKGVKIYIILFQEPQIAINNDSQFVERYMEQLHKNIKVLRHPKYLIIPFLWSHHEKTCLIDQRIAFLGGLDVCYGRWDNQSHSLTNDLNIWKGADFCNLRISDIYSPRNFLVSNIDHRTQPRMPWHDIAVQIQGQSVHDIARHFTDYWNFVNFQTKFDDRELLHLSGRNYTPSQNTKPRIHNILANNRVHPHLSEALDAKTSEEKVDSTVEGHYYQKYLDETVLKIGNLEIPKLQLPKFETIKESIKNYPKKILSYFKTEEEEDEKLLIANEDQVVAEGRHIHQILRSSCTWSLGLLQKNVERSIYSAYLQAIEDAEHFIYIENQFFICKENLIADKISQRIDRAYREKKPFKVIILLPLLPGFEGDIREDNSSVMRIQLHWEYWTICRSRKSLYSRLKHIENVGAYLQFYSLRQHGITQGHPITQILYIHSKLLIVDDKKAIVGSANINDRSMMGDRDSEMCIFIESMDTMQTRHGFSVCKQIQKMRIDLYIEHFGVTFEEAQNFLDESVWEMIKIRAKTNTFIYRQVFGCYPDDLMLKMSDIGQMQSKCNPSKYKEFKEDIVAQVVELPIHFLQNEDLSLTPKEKEFFLPNIFFT